MRGSSRDTEPNDQPPQTRCGGTGKTRGAAAPRRLPPPVRELRLVLVPHAPDTARWTEAEQAEAIRVMALELAEQCGDYGAASVLEALADAIGGDMADAADAARRRALQETYIHTAYALRDYARMLRRAEITPLRNS